MKIGDIEITLRSSGLANVMSGTIGLTDKQKVRKKELEDRDKPMTENMKTEYAELVSKDKNPQLPEGVKTYLDELVISAIYGFQKDTHSKYTAHGNATEHMSIDHLNIHLQAIASDMGQKVWIYEKNENRITKEDLFLTGEVDMVRPNYVLDVKSPYDPFTMNGHRKDMNSMYLWQGLSYCALYEVPVCYFAYVLHENYYMEQDEYENIDFLGKTYIDKVEFDKELWQTYLDRIPLIKTYIKESVETFMASKEKTKQNILEILKLES